LCGATRATCGAGFLRTSTRNGSPSTRVHCQSVGHGAVARPESDRSNGAVPARPRTSATGKGIIDLAEPANTVAHAHVTNEGFNYWKLTADKATADLAVSNSTLTIDNFEGDLYAGKLHGRASIALSNDAPYAFDFGVEHVDIHKLLAAIAGKESQVSGFMTGAALIAGQGSDPGKIKGNGKLSIEEGVLWEIPLFGIFSHIMNDIDTGLGTTKATKADATFTLGDKAAKTEDMTVAAGAFTLLGRGKLGFDGKLDFRIEARPLKSWPILGQFGFLLGKILEYKIGGTLGDYSYRPTNLPKEWLPHDDSQKSKTKDAEKPNAP